MRLMHPPATLTVQAVKSSLADSFCHMQEQKEGVREDTYWFLLRLQRASLFLHPYPERCSGLYSYWGFAPSLLKYKLPKIFAALPVLAQI